MKNPSFQTFMTVRSALLCIVLLSSGALSASAALAADAVSTHATSHSLTTNVNSDDKSTVAHSSDSSVNSSDDQDSNQDVNDDKQHDHSNQSSDNKNQGGRDNVQIFGNAHLQAGEHADDLVSVMGSSTNEGDVSQNVVSVLGNTSATGTVGQNAVAVLGNNYINNKVGQNVVAVLGNVELGPQAEVGHDVVAVGGAVKRDPGAVVHGNVQSVGSNFGMNGFEWLHSWIQNCLFKGRLLAFDSGVMWAWWVALIALAVYTLTALLFPRAVDKCVGVMEQKPGHVVLAGLLSTVGLPMVYLLLCITIVGIIAIPFINITLMIAGFFGKVVILAWIGRRIFKKSESGILSQPALAVLIGGLIVALLYTIPILSFLLHMVLGFLGLGVAVYALLLEIKSRRGDKTGGSSNLGSSADLADHGPATAHTDSSQAELNATAAGAAAPNSIPPQALNVLPRAGFWIRMVALLIDAFLIGAITSLVIHPNWFGMDRDHVIVTLLVIYGVLMWKLKGATIGDIICKLRVIRTNGESLDWSTAIVRGLSCFLSVMALGLGFIWIAFDKHKQAWHDMIAGTLVVSTPDPSSLL